MDWRNSTSIAHPHHVGSSNNSGNQRPLPPSKPVKNMREGDWECQEPGCGNINFSKRTKCHRCGVPKPKTGDPLKDIPHFGGPPGLFKQGDWPCTHCGNVNWARRDKCNMCNAPKPTQKMEPRTGRGGGHFDLQDPADRNQHYSDDEEFDEFGRKKRKKKKPGVYDTNSSLNNHNEAIIYGSNNRRDYSESYRGEDYAPTRMAFPPAPKSKARSRSPSSVRSSSSSSSNSTSSSNSSTSRPARSRTNSPKPIRHRR